MSSSLDLNGGTHTIPADTEEQYYQVVDTSANKDGTLVMSAGSGLILDDIASAGFASDWVGTFTVNGSSTAPCYIKSVDTNPHHPFTMALAIAASTWTRVRISGNAAFSSTNLITMNNVVWGYDTYCGVDDIRRLTGINSDQLTDADMSTFIEMAVDEIDDYTGRKWYTGTATNEDHDYWGGGFVKADYYPIQSITSVAYRGGSSWTTKTEGADDDYYAEQKDLDRGIIRLMALPDEDYQSVRLNYTFGDASASGRIRRLCTYMAAYDALLGTQIPEKGSTVQARLAELTNQIKIMKNQLGGKMRPWTGDNAEEYTYPKGRISDLRRYRGI